MKNFPDVNQLHRLKDLLWEWPKSKAALMIGAGFSFNAERNIGAISSFATWRQLAELMFEAIHKGNPEDLSPEALKEKFALTSSTKLASQFAAEFGETELQEFLRNHLPDQDYVPGELHVKLLSLPWVDIFTTNYDSLLERTSVVDRFYSVVSHPVQLRTSTPPRIIKLHGCFSAQTELVITEEHFRKYPRDHAPFVNTVQQSLLENAFVLVGFSGEDPNFLAWTGWIRDELNNSNAPIYLVGPLALSNSERKLLHKRGVTPIDLSSVITDKSSSKSKHYQAVEFLVDFLQSSMPQRPETWPFHKGMV